MSNNHVLGLSDGATAGQAITQPGEIETNCSMSGTITVANFTSFVSLEKPPALPVDVAIAQVINGEVDPKGNVLELGAVSGGRARPSGRRFWHGCDDRPSSREKRTYHRPHVRLGRSRKYGRHRFV